MIGAILRHPAVLPLKRATRDAWWRYKGRSISNPPLPAHVRSVLFVCLGNICRSPFAEVIGVRRAAAVPLPVAFASAGISARPDSGPPPEALRAAARSGVSLDTHRPVPLTRDVAEAHDLLVVMESQQADALRRRFPDLANRVQLLSLYDRSSASGMDRYNIADPFGQDARAFDDCYARIDRAVVSLLAAIRPADGDPVQRGRT